jgi:hypothetical protein
MDKKVLYGPEKSIEILLEEYKTLRTEILNRQNVNIKLFQFTIVALGAIIGILSLFLKDNLQNYQFFTPELISNFLLIFSTFAMTIIDASLFYTIFNDNQIHIIGAYIKKYIEGGIPELNWQSRWKEYKNQNLFIKTNMPRSVYYLFLAIPLVVLVSSGVLLGSIYLNGWFLIFLISLAFFIGIFLFSFHKKEPNWKNIS